MLKVKRNFGNEQKHKFLRLLGNSKPSYCCYQAPPGGLLGSHDRLLGQGPDNRNLCEREAPVCRLSVQGPSRGRIHFAGNSKNLSVVVVVDDDGVALVVVVVD